MNDEEARHLVWWQLISGSLITIGATIIAVGFSFSITAETGVGLTEGQQSYLRNLFFSYMASGTVMILSGFYFGAVHILNWGKKKNIKS